MAFRTDRELNWELWPSVVQTHFDDKSVGVQLGVGGRWFDIDVAYGPDRPPHCPASHPIGSQIVCALWPGHDCPHVAASKPYMDEMQFTIVGMRAAASPYRYAT